MVVQLVGIVYIKLYAPDATRIYTTHAQSAHIAPAWRHHVMTLRHGVRTFSIAACSSGIYTFGIPVKWIYVKAANSVVKNGWDRWFTNDRIRKGISQTAAEDSERATP